MKFKRLLHSFPIFLGLLVAPFIANGADLNEILKKGEVVIAVPEAFPPFGSVGKTGKHEGYDVDVAKLIAKDLGVKLKLVPVVSKQRIPFSFRQWEQTPKELNRSISQVLMPHFFRVCFPPLKLKSVHMKT